MSTEVFTNELEKEVEEWFHHFLGQYLRVECSMTRTGDYICHFRARNPLSSSYSRQTKRRIPKDEISNHGFVHAVTREAVRYILGGIR